MLKVYTFVMDWFPFILLSVGAVAVATILRKILLRDKKSDPAASIIVFQFLGAGIFLILVLHKGFVLPPITTYPLNFLLLAAAYSIGNLLVFKALKHIEASE